ncbi:MAG: nucleoside triphosphate pyrophosphohydrolase family protein [Varibaculum cambriense]|uniref:nucleoside triphosphate pyrophosphohydrolase family protein n=1 Tax=Varibaculum cambriense TaxID=184870 RepID=UPI001EBBF77E|nr:nucleoside triphosphate pyrophosphohydrolase family protein [Varibaculum cambriense]MBS5919044.1 nucleoside triphosphate pyrophosphohydrolase family protein [Varibaculum cambriense]MDU5541592.1 nucleoside triphosphate pyrophosphohydrolase family protein [Varibaculum cambriense]
MNEAAPTQQITGEQSEQQMPDPHRPEDLVRQFHEVYGLPIQHDEPEVDRERVHMRMRLIYEEVSELTGAVYGDKARRMLEETISSLPDDGTRDTIETADALADLIYVIYGMALECGISLPAVLREVQASNLSKLDGEGKPIYREDGKVLKGDNFFPPNVKSALKIRIPE